MNKCSFAPNAGYFLPLATANRASIFTPTIMDGESGMLLTVVDEPKNNLTFDSFVCVLTFLGLAVTFYAIVCVGCRLVTYRFLKLP
jgi:deoxyhypusine synthase